MNPESQAKGLRYKTSTCRCSVGVFACDFEATA